MRKETDDIPSETDTTLSNFSVYGMAMKSNHRSYLKKVTLIGWVALLVVGCRPSINEVIEAISSVPLGASRKEIRETLIKAFPKEVQHYDLTRPPLVMTKAMLEADKNVLATQKREGRFVYVYPIDLFDRIPNEAFFDMIGMIKESTIGGGSLQIIYDSNTNYIGFFGCSYEKVH